MTKHREALARILREIADELEADDMLEVDMVPWGSAAAAWLRKRASLEGTS